MPKRGGVFAHHSNNNGNNNNNGGRSGSRFSTQKDGADNDDHQRRKERHKRRVSFKPTQLSHKGDIKLRLQDVRRWDEDDEMSSEAKERHNARRRGSPIPSGGKFGKLIANSAGWYQVTIQSGHAYDKTTLMNCLLGVMSPHVFEPQYWRTDHHSVKFYVNDLELAERIQQTGRHAQLPNGFRLNPRVRCGIPLVTIDEEFKLKMKTVMAKRYNLQTKAIDLTRFESDADLKPIFCPLFRLNVMSAALDIICENIPDVVAINLNDNNISTMEAFKGVEKRLPQLKIIYLGDNRLPSLAHLLVIRNLPIEELVLRNNPCRSRYKDPQHFISEVRRKFPKLRKLDGEMLPPPLQVAPAKASFLCDSAGTEVVRQFLEQYFNIFDSSNRQPLLDAYHEQALLSISMPSVSQAGRLDKFWPFNRNLRRISGPEREDMRFRLLKSGRLACVSMLDEWPRTIHQRHTFTVDLTVYNPQLLLVFTVTGLFKELTDDAPSTSSTSASAAMQQQPYELRHFMRTFVVVKQNAGFCIRNETIFLTSATMEQTREFTRTEQQQQQQQQMATATAPSSSTQLVANAMQPPPIGGGINNPTTASTAVVCDATKLQMVQAMSAQSQMNLDWSRKCLEETNWDFNHAAFVFDKLFKENKIPPEAFVK